MLNYFKTSNFNINRIDTVRDIDVIPKDERVPK